MKSLVYSIFFLTFLSTSTLAFSSNNPIFNDSDLCKLETPTASYNTNQIHWSWGNTIHTTWLGKFIDWISKAVENGAYTEGNNRNINPYTTFSLEYNSLLRNEVRRLIIAKEHSYGKFYGFLFDLAVTGQSDDANSIKAAAFVYLIGLDAGGKNFTDTSAHSHDWFREKVENRILDLRNGVLDYDHW